MDDILTNREAMLTGLRRKLLKAQERMKLNADIHQREVSFKNGDWVKVKLRPQRQLSTRGSSYSKLAKRFYGPFK